ncbi:MAG: hypothetical protein WDN76_08445 [Alphaproteobacteria bacterium]
MALSDAYIVYPHRGYGMDQLRYAWRTPDLRSKIVWPAARR